MDILSLFGQPTGLLSILNPAARALPNPAQALLNLDSAERQIAEREKSGELPPTIARDPIFKRDMERFREALANATSVEELVKDRTVQKVLTTIVGLGDQSSYAAMVEKALLSDLADPDSVANQLGETNLAWVDLAGLFDLENTGLARIRDPIIINGIERDYAESLWRQSLDGSTPGLAAALSFKERAGEVDDYFTILGDPALREVVTRTLGIPVELALQSEDAQARTIQARLDLADLKDPKFVDTFMRRYLITVSSQNLGILV